MDVDTKSELEAGEVKGMIFLLKLWLILIGIIIIIFSSYTGLYYYYSKKPTKKFKNKIFPEATLVIPFYNEEIVMKKKIEDTSKINYTKNKLNIIFLNEIGRAHV